MLLCVKYKTNGRNRKYLYNKKTALLEMSFLGTITKNIAKTLKKMPVRKIKKNYRSVTGLIASQKNARMIASESTLERDLFTCLEFDPVVESYEEQPVLIEYKNENGKKTTYTPDVLIYFNSTKVDFRRSIFCSPVLNNKNILSDTPISCQQTLSTKPILAKRYNPQQPILAEVKYRSDLFEKWKTLKPKFKAAREFAKTKGWRFCIFTENELRGVLLNNIKFLSKFSRPSQNSEFEIKTIELKMEVLRNTTPKILLNSIHNDKIEQAKFIPMLWHLIYLNRIKVDLKKELTMVSEIYL